MTTGRSLRTSILASLAVALLAAGSAGAWNENIGIKIIPYKDEMELRWQLHALRYDMAFLQAMHELQLSKEQKERLLPIALKARARGVERTAEAYKVVRDSLLGDMHALMDHLIDPKTGKAWDDRNGGVYRPGDCKGFGEDVRALEKDALGVLTKEQADMLSTSLKELTGKQSVKDMRRALEQVQIPRQFTGMYWCHSTGGWGAMGTLLMAPNAVGWLEGQLGKDVAESETLARQAIVDNAQLQTLINYSVAGTHHRTIPAVNIYNGMNFNESQLTRLIDIAKESDKVYADHSAVVKKALAAVIEQTAKARDLAGEGKPIPKELNDRIRALSRDACGNTFINFCPVHQEFNDGLKKLVAKTVDVIGEERAGLCCRVNCCFLPPDYAAYNDPVRVGEATPEPRVDEQTIFEKLRTISAEAYDRERDAAVAARLAAMRKAQGDKFAEDRERVRLAELLDMSRTMGDADFKLHCLEMAAMFGGKPVPCEIRQTNSLIWSKVSADEVIGKEHGAWPYKKEERIVYFFVDPYYADVLAKYLAIARNYKPSSPADLDKLPGAEKVNLQAGQPAR